MPSKDPEKRRAASARYKKKHRERLNAKKRADYRKNREEVRARQKKYQDENREKVYAYNAKWQREYRAKLRLEMIAAYGGECVCCGESEPLFLDLDHINEDGKRMRAKYGGNNLTEMKSLKGRGWPSENHQLLCCNCHHGRHRNGGICPHKANTI